MLGVLRPAPGHVERQRLMELLREVPGEDGTRIAILPFEECRSKKAYETYIWKRIYIDTDENTDPRPLFFQRHVVWRPG